MKRVFSILLCILWMGFIFYNSTQNGTSSNGLTYKIVDKLITIADEGKSSQNIKVYSAPVAEQNKRIEGVSVKSLIQGIGKEDRVTLNKVIRKSAHAFEFLILAVLLCNAFFVWGFKGKKSIIYILFIVLLYAVTDEYHQIYVIGRGSSVKDVLIDFTGGIIGTTMYYIVYYTLGFFKKVRKN